MMKQYWLDRLADALIETVAAHDRFVTFDDRRPAVRPTLELLPVVAVEPTYVGPERRRQPRSLVA